MTPEYINQTIDGLKRRNLKVLDLFYRWAENYRGNDITVGVFRQTTRALCELPRVKAVRSDADNRALMDATEFLARLARLDHVEFRDLREQANADLRAAIHPAPEGARLFST